MLRHSAREARRLRLARSSAGRVRVIAYTLPGAAVRIISARLASRKERNRYAEARTAISVRVGPEVLSRLKATAAKRGMPYQSLINPRTRDAARRPVARLSRVEADDAELDALVASGLARPPVAPLPKDFLVRRLP